MCFSNLPIEFDEHGDPYLADEADAVERPQGAPPRDDASLAEDPTGAYEELLSTVSPEVRDLLEADVEEIPNEATARGD